MAQVAHSPGMIPRSRRRLSLNEELTPMPSDDEEDYEKRLFAHSNLVPSDVRTSSPALVPACSLGSYHPEDKKEYTTFGVLPVNDNTTNNTSTSCDVTSTDESAMNYSQEASRYLQEERLEEALESYQKAAEFYCRGQIGGLHHQPSSTSTATTSNVSLIDTINAAGCYRNMGAVSRLLHRYTEAATHLQYAEQLYHSARSRLTKTPSAPSNGDHKVVPTHTNTDIHNNNTTPTATVGRTSNDELCLDFLAIETMQSRASYYFQQQQIQPPQHKEKFLAQAMQCHEECVKLLIQLHQDAAWTNRSENSIRRDNIVMVPLSQDQHTDLLIVSLQNLAGMYRCDFTNSKNTDPRNSSSGLENLQTAVNILKERLLNSDNSGGTCGDEEDETASCRVQSVTQILRNLSEMYLERDQMDLAMDALHDAMDVELSLTAEPSPEALEAMDKMGLANEQIEQYDRALSCYEKALLARSRYYGENHIDVAKSLIDVARVMELQGNTEGGLDLYRAAHAIYALQIVSSELFDSVEDAAAILQLVPSLLDQERFEEARAYLTKCLAVAENDDDDSGDEFPRLDKSRVFYDLGRAYIGLHDYVSATICLLEAAKADGQVSEENVFALLQQVEMLQRQENRTDVRTSRSLDLDESREFTIRESLSNSREAISLPSREVMASATNCSGDVLDYNNDKRGKCIVLERPSWDLSRTELLPKNDYLTRNVKSHPSLGSTVPMIDLVSDTNPNFRGCIVGPEHASNFFETNCELKSTRSELSSILHESDTDELPSIAIRPILMAEGELLEGTRSTPLLISRGKALSDEDNDPGRTPVSSDSTQDCPKTSKGRGFRRGPPASPRKNKDDKSLNSQQQQQRPIITKVFGEKLRRPRRYGFQSLPDEKVISEPDAYELPTEEEATEEDSVFVGPFAILHIDGPMTDDDVSELTMRLEDPNSSRDNSHEWWWGVTAEGFGRWFPASYVFQAVQAADAFLSAKAIHAKSKAKPAGARAFDMESDDESIEDGGGSQEQGEYLSNVGITSTKASRLLDLSATDLRDIRKPTRTPHHNSLFSSPAPQHFTGGKDVHTEIASCRECLIKQQKEFGKTHAKVATSLFTLAILYSRDRDIEAALECAFEAQRLQMGNSDYEDAAQSLHFLADLYLHQKNYKQALVHYEKALKLETSHFGYYCDATTKTLNCIGTVKSLQNEFREAMDNHEEALRILKECHGDDLSHPLVSETLCQIGSVYYRERNSYGASTSRTDNYTTFIEGGMLEVIGRAHEDRGAYKMAIAFFEEKLRFLESKGESQEDLEEAATTLNGLGMLSSRAGLLIEAIEYYEKALSIQLQLGCDEVHLATARVLTGAVQFQLGNWQKALQLLRDALICLQDELGERHETVAATHFQIGTVQAALCDYDVAMDTFNEALDIQNELLGDEHPATLRTRREIGNLYAVYEAEVDAAFQHFNFILDIQKRVHGNRHPNIAETLYSIGCAYAKKRDYRSAVRSLEECYYMRVEFLGWDHPLQATTLHEIAKIHVKRGRLKKALHICDVVIGIRKDALSERHIDVARVLTTKASCLVGQGDTDRAMKILTEALAMAEESLGHMHPSVAEIHTEFGALHLRKCQFDAARRSIQKALDIYGWSNLDDDYYGIQDAKEKLERVARDEMLCV